MDVIKSSRFWLALLLIGGAIALAMAGKIAGTEALSWGAALLAGFGVAKSGGSTTVVALVLALGLSGCGSTLAATLHKAELGRQVAGEIGLTAFHSACTKAASGCAKGATRDTCASWAKCDDARGAFLAALATAGDGLATANRIAATAGISQAK